jgi:hypothetical protein
MKTGYPNQASDLNEEIAASSTILPQIRALK